MSDLSQPDRLAREVGELTAQLRDANATIQRITSPIHPAIAGLQIFTATIGGTKVQASCEVDPGEPPCADPEYAHPGSPPSIDVTHLWINGEWVNAEDLLGIDRTNELSETLSLESEL